jgi:hypothetical protein
MLLHASSGGGGAGGRAVCRWLCACRPGSADQLAPWCAEVACSSVVTVALWIWDGGGRWLGRGGGGGRGVEAVDLATVSSAFSEP